MKRFISIVLTIVILASCFSVSVYANTGRKKAFGTVISADLHGAGSSDHGKAIEDLLKPYVNVSSFLKVLENAIANCEEKIDITAYNIPSTDAIWTAIGDYIFYRSVFSYNVRTMGSSYWTDTYNFADISFNYHSFADTVSEYNNCKTQIVSASNKMLQGIRGNNKLTDEQKLLLAHDRLANYCEYGYPDDATTIESHTAFGVFGNRIAVCQGYAMAYMYLLDCMGFDNYYCSSETLNHAWNIVVLNGKKYHVDVTWDDILWSEYENGVEGGVSHDNFLRSSSGIYATGHEAFDYDTTPTDKTYDNYFWQNSNAEFQLINNEIYYIDNSARALKRYSDKKKLCSLSTRWETNDGTYWSDNYSRLSSDGKSLFYSEPKAIYRFDLETNKSEKIYSPAVFPDELIFGFVYEDGNLVCDIHDEPPGNSHYGKYQLKQPYKYLYPVECGDANEDYSINNKDLAMLMQHLNGWNVAINTNAADVNVDKKINNKDYALLMQYINGWAVKLG